MMPITYQKITLHLNMLASVNQKNKVNRSKRGRPQYTDPKYRAEENRMIQNAREQAEAVGWQVQPTDRYVLLYHLTFPDSSRTKHKWPFPIRRRRRDLHNPLKPICDALVKAKLLHDDNLTIQEVPSKLSSTEETSGACQATIILYRFIFTDIVPFPFPVDLEAVFDHLALQYDERVRAAQNQKKETTPHAVRTLHRKQRAGGQP